MVDTKDQSNALCMGCLSTLSILVFVVLTQHLIQSTMRCKNSTLLCIKWPLTPARREGYFYSTVFEKPSVLRV